MIYTVTGIDYHQVCLVSGHYAAVVTNSSDKWFLCDDKKSSAINRHEASTKARTSAYLIFLRVSDRANLVCPDGSLQLHKEFNLTLSSKVFRAVSHTFIPNG